MSMVVLWNPGASGAEAAAELRRKLESRQDCRIVDCSSPEQVTQIAREAADSAAQLIVAAGGDGTVNLTVNGLAAAKREVPLAILPLGTGNDFCRTLAIPLDPLEAAELLSSGQVQRVDRVRAEAPGMRKYYVNMGSGGLSADVVETADAGEKKRWGPLAYIRSAARQLTDLTQYEVDVRLDDETLPRTSLYNVVFANGRTTSGGLVIAPNANPQDGLLEVMLVTDSGLAGLALLAAYWVAGRHLEADQLIYRRAARVQIESRPPLTFSLDGDSATPSPTVFTVEKQALPVIVGPDYTPEPATEA